jgi:hypothetical protein
MPGGWPPAMVGGLRYSTVQCCWTAGILSLDLDHIPGEKYLVYSSTLMAYHDYLMLVGVPACVYS